MYARNAVHSPVIFNVNLRILSAAGPRCDLDEAAPNCLHESKNQSSSPRSNERTNSSPVGTTTVIPACWRLMRYDVKNTAVTNDEIYIIVEICGGVVKCATACCLNRSL